MEHDQSITIAGYRTTEARVGDVRHLRSIGYSEEAIADRVQMPIRIVRGVLQAAGDEAKERHERLAGVELDIADRVVREAVVNLEAVVSALSLKDEAQATRAVTAIELRDKAIRTLVLASDNRRKAINRASDEVLSARESEELESVELDTEAPEGLPDWLANAAYPATKSGESPELA